MYHTAIIRGNFHIRGIRIESINIMQHKRLCCYRIRNADRMYLIQKQRELQYCEAW
jgi:hypothetical protein